MSASRNSSKLNSSPIFKLTASLLLYKSVTTNLLSCDFISDFIRCFLRHCLLHLNGFQHSESWLAIFTVQLLNIAVQLLNIAVQLENNCTATNGKIYTGYAIKSVINNNILSEQWYLGRMVTWSSNSNVDKSGTLLVQFFHCVCVCMCARVCVRVHMCQERIKC